MHHFFYYSKTIHFVTLSGELDAPSLPHEYEIRFAARDDIPALAHMHRSEAVYTTRFDKGYRAILCLYEGEVVHMEWFTSQPYLIWDTRVTFDPGAEGLYLFDLYTHPIHQGKGIWRLAAKKLLEHVQKERGKVFLYSAIDSKNEPAYNAHIKGGFSKISSLTFHQFFGVRRWEYIDHARNDIVVGGGLVGVNATLVRCTCGHTAFSTTSRLRATE